MSLRDLIADVRGREKTLVVAAPESEAHLVEELRADVGAQNLVVEHEPSEDGVLRAELRRDGTVVDTADADAIRALAAADGAAVSHTDLFDHGEEATFTSYGTDQMMQATREIEDRAWRVNQGSLHAGFQFLSAFSDQEEVYRRLGRSDLSVHVYGYADADADPPEGPFEVHLTDDPEVRRLWFVVFDGGGTEEQKCALLAEERESRHYFGFWTYEPEMVDAVLATLPAGDAPRT